jgi:DNA-directed RNA polymerase specialized sigma subunit
MSRGQEYQSKHIALFEMVPPADWSVPLGNPLSADVQYALRHGKISDEVRDLVAAEIDQLLADGGVAEYLGSVRRLYTMCGTVPSIKTITEELNCLHGVPFVAYEQRKNEYTAPITEDAVSTWKQKRDQIVEILLGYGTRWASWYFNKISDYLTQKELESFAEETVFKIVTFNWDFSGQPRSGRTHGVDVIHLVMASMKKMLFHHEFRKVRLQDNVLLYDDQQSSFDAEPIDMEDAYIAGEDGIPEPERPVSGTPRLLRSPFRVEKSEDGPMDTPYASAKDLQKVSLRTIFAIMQTLSPSDQYLLFSYFGYINQGLRQPEICAMVNVSQPEMSRAWHRLHSAILSSSYPPDIPEGNLQDWIRSLNPPRIAQDILDDKAQRFVVLRLITMVEKFGMDNLDANAKDVMNVILKNVVCTTNGVLTHYATRMCDALSNKFGVPIRWKDLKIIINEMLIPQLDGDGFDPDWFWEFLRNKQAIAEAERRYAVFDGLLFGELAPDMQQRLLQVLNKKRQNVVVLVEGLDRGGEPRTCQEVADISDCSRQNIQQIVSCAYTKMLKFYPFFDHRDEIGRKPVHQNNIFVSLSERERQEALRVIKSKRDRAIMRLIHGAGGQSTRTIEEVASVMNVPPHKIESIIAKCNGRIEYWKRLMST